MGTEHFSPIILYVFCAKLGYFSHFLKYNKFKIQFLLSIIIINQANFEQSFSLPHTISANHPCR